MQFITDFFVAVAVAYLSFTNMLADKLLTLLPTDDALVRTEEAAPTTITPLPSLYEERTVPNFLRQSAAFQQAAVIGSAITNTYTNDPLKALVNIFCTFATPEYIRTTTGTGFFVHSDGVILTNAHVAQFLLLGSTNLLGQAECVIRHGDPAAIAYAADLLYIPPAWVQENATIVNAANPMGTGERDYALLYVRESLTGEPLPAMFPALPVDTDLLPISTKNDAVTAAGYPASDFVKNGASTPLLPKQATTTVSELYTFGSNYADVFSVRGSNVGAEGSSGGPVLNEAGKVIGMIVTRGDDAVDGAGSLRAITLSHISRTIEEETGLSFTQNISGDLPKRSDIFTETIAPFLLTLLRAELNAN